MSLSESDLKRLAEGAAQAAADFIESRSGEAVAVMNKEGGDSLASQVVTEVDELAQGRILEVLDPSFDAYGLGSLTEKSEDDGGRLEKDYFWCIDPLDGTLPFTPGIPGYGVSIALVRQDGVPMIGAIADPTTGTRYLAISGQGIQRNGEKWIRPKCDQVANQTLY